VALASILMLGAIGAYDRADRLPCARLRSSGQLVLPACGTPILMPLLTGGLRIFARTVGAVAPGRTGV
jgi:hypothetical protein